MSQSLKLETVDVDGAIREMAAEAGFDRSDFLKKGALAGGGILVGSAVFDRYLAPAEAAISSKRRSAANDVKILNYALTLEYLEAAFYAQAVANNAFSDARFRRFGEVVAAHEAAHVKFLKGALKSKAVKKPAFDFGNAVTDPARFAATAQVLEDTGVAAYLGQAANIKQAPVLKAAGSVLAVEARHAAWIRTLNGGGEATADTAALPAPKSFDTAKTERAILKAVTATGFIKG